MIKQIGAIFFLVALLASGLYEYNTQTPSRVLAADMSPHVVAHNPSRVAADEPVPIFGSGTIEAETITIAAETGGRVVAVHADEGAEVKAGEVLVELEASLLLAQQAELEAAIETARANLTAVKDRPQPEEVAVAEAELVQAKVNRDSAHQVWQDALRLVERPQPLLVPIRELEAQIKQAEGAVESAQADRKTAAIEEEAASRDQSSHAALVGYEIAQKQTQAADISVKLAEARLQALRIQLAHLWEQYTNPVTLQAQAHQAEGNYQVAEAAVSLSQAKLDAVRAGATTEEVAVAQAQVGQAESALALLKARLAQLILTAPQDGLITTRVADPGELATPGATLLQLADLNHVTLRVFIPETQIGRVKLGQQAWVTIDSVDRPFAGVVTFIANEAEFTPKNVQTQEERVNLVFAVEVSLDNPEHILKPGMPADVEILP